jgi:serine/threonine-protein kinase
MPDGMLSEMGETSAGLLERLASSIADRYRVIRMLGEGGMATVYLANDLRHGRTVAVKVLKPHLTEGVGAERFLREIGTSARLNHPHILPLLDSGRAGDLLFYVMPFVEGESLRDRLHRGRLPLDEAVRFIAEIADGLGYAHRAGIIHRDVKPENVLVSSGHAVITDFGIAKALDTAGESHLTRTGAATGTPFYMSPEQWDSAAKIDGRSDQYALGCVAYEMLTGQRPYAASTTMALMLKHMTEPIPSLRKSLPGVPANVDAAIATAMAKLPENRFVTAEDFAAALRSATAPIPAGPRIAGRSVRISRNAIIATTAAVLLAVGGYTAYRLRSAGNNGPTRLAVLPFQNQGPSTDSYFADGVSEEITNRLAGIASLAVIARTSAAQYRGSNKTSRQIGDELGVEYLIEGTVRFASSNPNQGAVRVTARLIRVSDGDVLWPYDTTATMEDVFAIQTGIAQQMTQKLSVLLLEPERRRLATQPTDNIEAYRYYLQGNVAYERSWARQDVESALSLYQKAIDLDPRFALAWAKLSRTHAWVHQLKFDLSADRLVKAKHAADRAIALDPELSEAHLAMGLYWYWGMGDYERALTELTRAGALQASNAQVHLQIGNIRRRQGRFPESIASYRRSADLNPRSHNAWFNLGETLLFVRNYEQAGPPLRKVTDLAPDFLEGYVQQARLAVSANGDLETARRILRTAEERIPPTAWRAPMLDFVRIIHARNLQVYLDRLRPGAYGLDSTTYHVVKGRFLLQMGTTAAATAEFDSARAVLERMRDRQPGLAWIHSQLGVAYAGLHRTADAVREEQLAMELQPVSRDALEGPDLVVNLANVYVLLGNADSAAVYYDRVLSIPSWFSLNTLRVDPLYSSFVRTPQFAKLEEKWAPRRGRIKTAQAGRSPRRRTEFSPDGSGS